MPMVRTAWPLTIYNLTVYTVVDPVLFLLLFFSEEWFAILPLLEYSPFACKHANIYFLLILTSICTEYDYMYFLFTNNEDIKKNYLHVPKNIDKLKKNQTI